MMPESNPGLPASPTPASRGEKKRRTVQLLVAEGCNLRCDYCFEHHKNPAFQTFQVAVEAITPYLNGDPAYEEVMIDFMGGEPMLAFPLIQRVVEYVENRRWKKPYGFSMSTNGTLFTEENKSWFIRRKRYFTPMLSFDGTKTAHDMNRSGSFDRVEKNIPFLIEHWPFQKFKMTVNDRSLPYLADGVFSVLARGGDLDLNLVHENVWGEGSDKKRHLQVLERELARLVDFFTENPGLQPPNLVSLPISKCISPKDDRSKPWCGAGDAMVAVDRTGTKYPCHRFVKFSAGKALPLEKFAALPKETKKNHICESCPMKSACPTCQGCNWECTGSTTDRVTYNCEMLKLQMIATAAIQLNRISAEFSEKGATLAAERLYEMERQLEAARFAFSALAGVPQNELKPYVTGDWPNGKKWEQRVRWHSRPDNSSPSSTRNS